MKSKKAFMLGAAVAASCFVSAFALAEQYPQKLSAEAVRLAVDKALKSGGKLETTQVSTALKQKLKAAMAGNSKPAQSKAAVSGAPVDVQVDALNTADPAQLKGSAIAAFTPLFPTLDINTLYTVSGVETGAQIAYHFNLPKNARIQVQLLNQSAGLLISPLDIPGVAVLISAGRRVAGVWRPAVLGACVGILVRTVGHAYWS